MPARAAAQKNDAPDVPYPFRAEIDALFKDNRTSMEAVLDGLCNCLRLLMDLLEHEMRVAGFLCGFDTPLYLVDGFFFPPSIVAEDSAPISGQDANFLVIQIHDFICMLEDGRHIRSDEMPLIPHADDKGTLVAHCDEFSRLLQGEDSKGIAPFQLMERQSCGLFQRDAFVEFLYQMDNNLAVRL